MTSFRFLAFLLASSLSLLIMLATWVLWTQHSTRSLDVPGSYFDALMGDSQVSGDSTLLSTGGAPQVTAAIQLPPQWQRRVFEQVSVHVSTGTPQTVQASLGFWPEFGEPLALPLRWSDSSTLLGLTTPFSTRHTPMAGIGVAFALPPDMTLELTGMRLRAEPPATLDILQDLWHNLREPAGWTGVSINLFAYTDEERTTSLVLFIVGWMILSALFLVLATLIKGDRAFLVPGMLGLLALGWLASDLRWQDYLSQSVLMTAEQYAGLRDTARHQAGQDTTFFNLARRFQELDPEPGQRVFLISQNNESWDYFLLRLKYHLLPWPATHHLPALEHFRSGDYIMLIGPGTPVFVDTLEDADADPDTDATLIVRTHAADTPSRRVERLLQDPLAQILKVR